MFLSFAGNGGTWICLLYQISLYYHLITACGAIAWVTSTSITWIAPCLLIRVLALPWLGQHRASYKKADSTILRRAACKGYSKCNLPSYGRTLLHLAGKLLTFPSFFKTLALANLRSFSDIPVADCMLDVFCRILATCKGSLKAVLWPYCKRKHHTMQNIWSALFLYTHVWQGLDPNVNCVDGPNFLLFFSLQFEISSKVPFLHSPIFPRVAHRRCSNESDGSVRSLMFMELSPLGVWLVACIELTCTALWMSIGW